MRHDECPPDAEAELPSGRHSKPGASMHTSDGSKPTRAGGWRGVDPSSIQQGLAIELEPHSSVVEDTMQEGPRHKLKITLGRLILCLAGPKWARVQEELSKALTQLYVDGPADGGLEKERTLRSLAPQLLPLLQEDTINGVVTSALSSLAQLPASNAYFKGTVPPEALWQLVQQVRGANGVETRSEALTTLAKLAEVGDPHMLPMWDAHAVEATLDLLEVRNLPEDDCLRTCIILEAAAALGPEAREAMRDVGAMSTLIRALSRAEVLNRTLKPCSVSQMAYGDLLTALTIETDPNASSAGRLALHWAAQLGDNQLVQEVLDKTAVVDVPDDMGNTALHLAAATGRVHAVKLLLLRNADVTLPNAAGHVPFDLAPAGSPTQTLLAEEAAWRHYLEQPRPCTVVDGVASSSLLGIVSASGAASVWFEPLAGVMHLESVLPQPGRGKRGQRGKWLRKVFPQNAAKREPCSLTVPLPHSLRIVSRDSLTVELDLCSSDPYLGVSDDVYPATPVRLVVISLSSARDLSAALSMMVRRTFPDIFRMRRALAGTQDALGQGEQKGKVLDASPNSVLDSMLDAAAEKAKKAAAFAELAMARARQVLSLISERELNGAAANKYHHSAFYSQKILELYRRKAEELAEEGGDNSPKVDTPTRNVERGWPSALRSHACSEEVTPLTNSDRYCTPTSQITSAAPLPDAAVHQLSLETSSSAYALAEDACRQSVQVTQKAILEMSPVDRFDPDAIVRETMAALDTLSASTVERSGVLLETAIARVAALTAQRFAEDVGPGTPDASPNTTLTAGESLPSFQTLHQSSAASHLTRCASISDTNEAPGSCSAATAHMPLRLGTPYPHVPHALDLDSPPPREALTTSQGLPEDEVSPCVRIPTVLDFHTSPSEQDCRDAGSHLEPSKALLGTGEALLAEDVLSGPNLGGTATSAPCDSGALSEDHTSARLDISMAGKSAANVGRSAKTPPMSPFLKVQVIGGDSYPTSPARKGTTDDVALQSSGDTPTRPLRRTLSFTAAAKGSSSPELRLTLSTPPGSALPGQTPAVDEMLWSDVMTPDVTAPHRPYVTNSVPRGLGSATDAFIDRGSGLSLTECLRADCLAAAIAPSPDASIHGCLMTEKSHDGWTASTYCAMGKSWRSSTGCTPDSHRIGDEPLVKPTVAWDNNRGDPPHAAGSPLAQEWRCAANTFLSLRPRTPATSDSSISGSSSSSVRGRNCCGQTRFADLPRDVIDLPSEPGAESALAGSSKLMPCPATPVDVRTAGRLGNGAASPVLLHAARAPSTGTLPATPSGSPTPASTSALNAALPLPSHPPSTPPATRYQTESPKAPLLSIITPVGARNSGRPTLGGRTSRPAFTFVDAQERAEVLPAAHGGEMGTGSAASGRPGHRKTLSDGVFMSWEPHPAGFTTTRSDPQALTACMPPRMTSLLDSISAARGSMAKLRELPPLLLPAGAGSDNNYQYCSGSNASPQGEEGPTEAEAIRSESGGLSQAGSTEPWLAELVAGLNTAFLERSTSVRDGGDPNLDADIATPNASPVSRPFAISTPNRSPASVQGADPPHPPSPRLSPLVPADAPNTSFSECLVPPVAEHEHTPGRATEIRMPSDLVAMFEDACDPCDEVFTDCCDAKLGSTATPAPSPSLPPSLDPGGEEEHRRITSWEASSAQALQNGVMSLLTPWGSIPIPPRVGEAPMSPVPSHRTAFSTSPSAYSNMSPPRQTSTAGQSARGPVVGSPVGTNFRRYKRHSSLTEGDPEGWLSPGPGNAESERPRGPGWNPVLGYMRSQPVTPRTLSYKASIGSPRTSLVGEWWSPQTGQSLEKASDTASIQSSATPSSQMNAPSNRSGTSAISRASSKLSKVYMSVGMSSTWRGSEFARPKSLGDGGALFMTRAKGPSLEDPLVVVPECVQRLIPPATSGWLGQ